MPLSLQTLLKIDAATCALMGAALVASSQPLGELLHIPTTLLFWAGVVLLPTAGFMTLTASATHTPRWASIIIVIGNASWTLASLLLPAVGAISPNMLGWTFLVAQAAAVAVLTKLEYDAAPCFTRPAPEPGQRSA